MEIEESLGYLPENWTNLSIEQLENLPKSSLQKTQKKTPLKSLTNIDSLRAFACILVVAFHVFGSYPHYGLGFSMDSPLRSIFDVFDLLRMPLFTALAGVMFVAILPDEKKIPKFLSSKVTSLLLPAIVVSIIYFILRTVTGKEDGNLGNYLVSGYLHFWYLYSLFAIVAVIGAIHLRFKPSFKKYCIGIFILFLLNLLIPNSFLFWMRSAIELSPFFILGILLYKYTDKFYNKKLLYNVCLIALLGTTLRALSFFEVVDRDFVFTYLTFITSLSLVIISYFYFPKVKSIQWVGIYSYAIYLWHPAAASSFRALLNFSGINNRLILFVLLLFVGILVPILIYKVAQYLPRFIRMAFVGR
jgi:peptidoglycan/LPS O-acetylase OafA/YrhL